MSPPASIIVFFAVFALSEARVSFTNSEVLQANDLLNKATAEATFSCGVGCKVFVDRRDDYLAITQNGKLIATFNDIVGNNTYIPDGIVLPAANNYKLISTRLPISDFVFYCVSIKAPNYGVSVGAPQKTTAITANGQGRYMTFISSSNALSFYAISGQFQNGYPKIYTAGFDSVTDGRCSPVFQARTQYNGQQSRPVIFAPIVTIDFGYNGVHSMGASQDTGKDPYAANVATTVFMSPGYVGCTSVGSQQYYSNVRTFSDSFSLPVANSLDISAVYTNVAASEPVLFRVNKDILDFSGSKSFSRKYSYGSFDVSLSWSRVTAASNWAIQLDFGTSSAQSFSVFIASLIVMLHSAL